MALRGCLGVFSRRSITMVLASYPAQVHVSGTMVKYHTPSVCCTHRVLDTRLPGICAPDVRLDSIGLSYPTNQHSRFPSGAGVLTSMRELAKTASTGLGTLLYFEAVDFTMKVILSSCLEESCTAPHVC